MKKVKINGRETELTGSTRWDVREIPSEDGRLGLYNCNTRRFEGIEGDLIEYYKENKPYRGYVVGYTCFRFVRTVEHGKDILTAYDAYNNMRVLEHNGEIENYKY